MNIITTDNIKENLIYKLTNTKINNRLLLLSYKPTEEEIYYKDSIIKRCDEFGIEYIDKVFEDNISKAEIVDYINSHNENDGFIIFLPFGGFGDLEYLKDKIQLKDLDGFTYKTQGKAANGHFDSLPATPKAIARFLENHTDVAGKNVVIANRTNLIGIPLASYLAKKGATVTVINSKTKNDLEIIRESDIFISAIGRANYYDYKYFRDGQLLVDVGTSELNGKIIGDINFESLKDLDLEVLTNKKGIGAITTLSLIESLI